MDTRGSVLILAIDWIPQNTLRELARAGRSFTVVPWTFMLGFHR